MTKLKYSGIILFLFVGFVFFTITLKDAMADQNAMPTEGPTWSVGDWWVLEQTKMDLSSPTAHWKEPLLWRCDVKAYSESPELFVLEIRSASGLKTGVDVVYAINPWEVKKIRKMIATADGIKSVEREINSSGPVMELNSPFALVLPGFPWKNTSSSHVAKSITFPNSAGTISTTLRDSSSGGPAMGVRYNLGQEVSVPENGDPLLMRGEAAVNGMRGNVPADMIDASSKISITMGRKQAFQLWSTNAPWALAEETPHSRTTLIENHKGVTP
jgi:hypothetical protein